MFRSDGINEDAVLKELAQLKSEKQEDETHLVQLTRIKEQTIDLTSVETKLNEFCHEIKESLDICTVQTKCLALDILDVQVIATPEKLDIKAVVPLEFITIEQTLGYQLIWTKSYPNTGSMGMEVLVSMQSAFVSSQH